MRNHYTITSHTPSRLLRFLTAAMVAAVVGTPHASAQSQGQLFASVTTQEGEPVLDLTADSFQIQEDGVTMKILSADPGTTPMKVAVLVDNSEAINASNGLTALRRGITGFLETLPLQHEVGLFSIAGRVAPLVDFTNDRDELLDAADGLFAGTGGAKMIDGMRETWDRRFSSEDAWPVMVMVVTDGPETSGNMNEDQFGAFTLDLLSRGAMVHVVVVETRGGGVQSQIGQNLTTNTGGFYRSMNSPTALTNTLNELATTMGEHFDEMSPRYRLLYERPSDTPGAQMGAGVVGPNYKMQLFADRRMPPQ
jgi:Mg-chelatase subunit ChlD